MMCKKSALAISNGLVSRPILYVLFYTSMSLSHAFGFFNTSRAL